MDKNCCGGGEACGYVYCVGQDSCVRVRLSGPDRPMHAIDGAVGSPRAPVSLSVPIRALLRSRQSWEVDDFDSDCAPGAKRRQLQKTMPTHVTLSAAAGAGLSMPVQNLGTCCGSDPKVGVTPWVTAAKPHEGAATIGIDTAWDYHPPNQPNKSTMPQSTRARSRRPLAVSTPAAGALQPAASADATLHSPIKRLHAAQARAQLPSPQQRMSDDEKTELFTGLPLTTLMMKIGDGNLATPDLKLAHRLISQWRGQQLAAT
eukprot:SAG22_NODE_634_length_8373_cov_4.731085_3_plen_260_part_00